MIKCKKCGYETTYTSPKCPECHTPYTLTKEEIIELIDRVQKATKVREYSTIVEIRHLLADMGHPDSIRIYAQLLENGNIVDRNLDLAMDYFYRAASNGDAFSAYRYSRLAERTNGTVAAFWLAYSCVMGCTDAYPAFARKLSEEGDEDSANYYFTLSSEAGNNDSTATLAKRYYNGIGVAKNDEYAKYYLEKFAIPPITLIKMAFKLRSVKSREPEAPQLKDYDKMLRALANQAHELNYKNAYHGIIGVLSERGNAQCTMILGLLELDGVGCHKNVKNAIELLTKSAEAGVAEGYKRLGDLYLIGKDVERNADTALEYYKKAAELGMTNAYENMGDIFHEGKIVDKDIPEALRLYELAAAEGHPSARAKADKIRDARKNMYDVGAGYLKERNPEAYRMLYISAIMGYVPAYSRLADCYVLGLGTKRQRHEGYLWYKRAVEAGDSSALLPLGYCYSRGVGTAFNLKAAVEVLVKADAHGIIGAKEEVLKLLERKTKHIAKTLYSNGMSLIYQREFERAKAQLEIAYKLGHAKAAYTLACMHEFGLGTPTNRDLAFAIYEESFSMKFRDPKAVYKLKVLKMARNYD